MIPVAPIRRAGMTLVELLVVVAILGLLAVTVLPALSTSAEARRTREAARIVSSYIAKAQSRAIGRTEWAGFWLTTPTTNPSANFSIDLDLANVPAVFRGDSTSATVSGSQSGAFFVLTSGSLTGTVSSTSGDLVRFDGQPPWFAYHNATTIGLRNGNASSENINQTPLNTPWPAANTPHRFEILRQPTRAGSPVSLADGRCIDLTWSGHGGADLASYSTFDATGAIAILFDGTGRLRQLFYNGNRVNISGPIFLLVGRTDRAGNVAAALNANDDSVGANWQYSDSFWIAIDPLSGVAKTAECAPNADNVFRSQYFIRSEIPAGAR